MVCNVTICGGGNGAHVLAALSSRAPDTHVTIYTIPDEAKKLREKFAESGGIHVTGSDGVGGSLDFKSVPHSVTSNPEECFPKADIIFMCLPAFVHGRIFTTMKPFLKSGVLVVGLPGQTGFEFEVKACLGEVWDKVSIMNFVTLPWACRIEDYGKHVNVVGTKLKLRGASLIHSQCKPSFDYMKKIKDIIGTYPELQCDFSILTVSLMSLNGVLHPSILYEQWVSWDGAPLDEAPLFYQGITQAGADRVDGAWAEVMAVGDALGMDKMMTPLERYRDSYASQIEDDSTLFSAIRTNSGYIGLTHPTNKTPEGKFVPDFQHRYLTEDLPIGLCVVKGIAELAAVKTPVIDQTLTWAQKQIGKEYIVDGKLNGKHVGETRAPQKFNITKQDLIDFNKKC